MKMKLVKVKKKDADILALAKDFDKKMGDVGRSLQKLGNVISKQSQLSSKERDKLYTILEENYNYAETLMDDINDLSGEIEK